jgi:hypothetical protein
VLLLSGELLIQCHLLSDGLLSHLVPETLVLGLHLIPLRLGDIKSGTSEGSPHNRYSSHDTEPDSEVAVNHPYRPPEFS